MNHLKTSPVGIDYVIDQIQKQIYDPLTVRWGSLDIYGRVYSNVSVTEEGREEFVLERYAGNGEYVPVLTSEGNKIFFIQGNNVSVSYAKATNELWLVAIVNIESINAVQHRADEEIHVDLLTELSRAVPMREIQEVQYGIKNLRSIADEAFEDSNFRFSDIHPNHVFMVRIASTYSLIEKNC